MTPKAASSASTAKPVHGKVVMKKVFDAAYAKLNPQQKEAVDTVEGPVMVVAGPGTGKTQVVALRVANILQKTQMRPSNILCLTFSLSGAVAMRERLRSLIGPDAYGVTIKNYHSFCNELIADYPLVFDSWSALEQISDVERYREVNKIIDQLLPDIQLVNRKQPYLRTGEILSRISQLKREGKTDRDELLSIADAYEQELSTKSKEGTKAHERNVLTAQKFREFLQIFFAYQDMLKATQRYDYEDMILYVIQALEEEQWLLQSLQERYQYVLVDEFQDTNGSQYRLTELLTSYESVDHTPNLFVVGDDDQAIYRFQGANLTNILAYKDRFPNAPVIALTTSYRCSQPILDAAGSLIAQNTERLVGKVDGLEKDLTSGKKAEAQQPQLLFSPSDMTEPWLIADLVEERIKQGTAPEEIAVLVQKNAELEVYYDVLSARDIPVQMTGKVDLLSHPLVQQTIAILKAVEHPRDSGALAAALGCACFDCHPADLGRIYAYLRESEETVLLDVLLKIESLDLLLNEMEKIVSVRDTILDLHQKLGSRTVVQTMEHVLKDCRLLSGVDDSDSPFDPLDFAALQEFFERIKYRAYEQPSFGIKTLLSDLEYYEAMHYRELRLSYDLPHLTEHGVQLMTAHQSKGLEFDTVILANFRHGHWDKKRSPSSISMPEDLLFGWEKDQKAYERTQDERRVAYVAMTRARNELIFTCPNQMTSADKVRDVSPSAFFAEAGELPEQEVELKNPEQTSSILFEPVLKMDEALSAFLRQRLENYALSVTALNHFLEDPQMFLELDLLQTPQSKESSLVYGNAVHEALRQWGLVLQQGKQLSQDEFIGHFTTYLNEREILTEAEKARLKKLGEESLPRYYEQRLSGFSPIVHRVEFGITTSLGDIPIKGKIDRIDLAEPDSARATVIDYKTGRPKTESQILEGGYHRQLVFYALLIENGASILKPEQFVLDFVGESSEHPVLRPFTISQQEKDELRAVIENVWEKVQSLDFTPID